MGTETLKHQRKTSDDKAVKDLIFAIFSQAINDYKNLKISSSTKKRENKDNKTSKEIEKFFKGNWCNELLDGLNVNMTGKEILHKIKNEQ